MKKLILSGLIALLFMAGVSWSPQKTLAAVLTDTGVHAEPALPSLPAAGGKITDPAFGTAIMRLTDGSDGNPDCYVQYSYRPTFNKDNTLAQAICWVGGIEQTKIWHFNPDTFARGSGFMLSVLTPSGYSISSTDSMWSGVYPNVLLGHPDNAQTLNATDVIAGTNTVIKDFTSLLPAGRVLFQMSRSIDDNVFAFTIAQAGNTSVHYGYIVWKRDTNTVLLNKFESDVDEVQIDKTGRFLTVVYDSGDDKIWDLQPATPTSTNLVYLTDGFYHHDSGHGMLLTIDVVANGMSYRSLSAPHTTRHLVDFASWNQDMHYSMLADDESWGVISRFSFVNAGVVNPYDNEIFQVAMDGSGSVRRLAHHRSVYNDYRDGPMANISRDGKYIAFTSNWGNASGRRDVFVAQIPAAPGSADTAAPTVPSNLTATAVSSAQINLSWTASTDSTGVTGYRIYRNGSHLSNTSAASYQDTGLNAATSYSYTVSAYDAAGNNSAQSSSASASTQAAADTASPVISAVTASSITQTSAAITWTTNEAADSQVEYGTTASYGHSTALNTSLAASHSVSLTGLSANTTYHFKVKSKDNSGNLSQSTDNVFTTIAAADTAAPSVPSGLAATAVSTSQINLSWTASTDSVGVAGYRIYRTGSFIATTTAASYSDTGLPASTSYSYTVSAYDAAGNNSAQSSAVNVTTQSPADTTAPVLSSISAGSLTQTTAAITWTTNEAADSQVEYGINTSYGSLTPLNASLTLSHSVSLSSLSAGTTYHYRVKSRDQAGNLSTSIDKTFITTAAPDTAAPSAIANLSVSSLTQTSAVLSFTSPGDDSNTGTASTYDIRYSTSNITGANFSSAIAATGEPAPAAVGTSQTYTLVGLSAGTTYYVAIKTSDEVPNVSAISNVISFTTNAPADTTAPVISSVASSAITQSAATITWSTNEQADSQVEYGTTVSYGLSSTLNTSLVASHTVNLTGLSANTTYHYKVKSKDISGNLSQSSDYTFITPPIPDTTAPVISNVQTSNLTPNTVTITWVTNEPSDTQAEYGTTSAYGSSSALNASLALSHSVSLTGLADATLYHFRVKSKDLANNPAQSSDYTFTTTTPPPPPDTTPPVFASVAATNITSSSTTITWTTNEPSSSRIAYGRTGSYGSLSPLDSTLSASHSVSLTGLKRGITYHFQAYSADSSNNPAQSSDFTFTTLSRLPKPPQVTNLSAVNGSVILSWGSPVDDDGNNYEHYAGSKILRSTAAFIQTLDTASQIADVTAPALTYADTAVSANTTYYYTIFAYDDLGIYSNPSFISFTTPNPPANTGGGSSSGGGPSGGGGGGGTIVSSASRITNFHAEGLDSQVILSWTNPADATFVRTVVVRKTGSPPVSASDGVKIYEGQAQTFTDTSLANSQTYYYGVFPVLLSGTAASPSQVLSASPVAGKTQTSIMAGSILPASVPKLVSWQGTFYLVRTGNRYGITSPGILYSLGFEFKDAKAATADDQALPEGLLLLPGDGSLVKGKSDKTVYFISKQTKYAFTSEQVFTSLSFKFSSVLTVTDPELAALPKGELLNNGSIAHLPGTDINDNGTIYWIDYDGRRQAYPSLAIYNSWHRDNDFSQVVPANASDKTLPQSSNVAARAVE